MDQDGYGNLRVKGYKDLAIQDPMAQSLILQFLLDGEIQTLRETKRERE